MDVGNAFGDAVLTGSLLLAVPVALLAGLVSFLSPCVLPLVPGYLGYVTGLSGAELAGGRRGHVVLGSALFVAGFTAVFVSYGALFGGLGGVLREYAEPITRVMGAVTIALGLLFAGWLPGLSGEWRARATPRVGLLGAPALGIVFGIGWTPCIGPTLAAVQVLAFEEASAGRGALLAVVYCIGLGVPFIAAAVAYRGSGRAFAWVRRHQLSVMRAGGILLIAVGVLLVSGVWADLLATMQGWISGFEVAV
jgi:cytochrome c-type biogenesis protein